MLRLYGFSFLKVLLLVCLPGAVAEAQNKRIPLILSTDVGNEIDDQWTIVYTLLNPLFDVRGIVSAHAPVLNPPAAHTSYRILVDIVENRLRMLQHPPLFEGASLPLEGATPRRNAGVDFIIEQSKSFSRSNRLNVLAIGAVTDVASAILIDPSITERIKVVDMGFQDWPDGVGLFNIDNDVQAMKIVLDSDVPLVIGSAEVCRRHLSLNLDQAKALVGGRGPIGEWLCEEFVAFYYRFVKPLRKEDFSGVRVIWDNVVLAYLLDMTAQETYPRPRMKDDTRFEHPKTQRTITWITSIDEKRMWADFIRHLDQYQQSHALGQQGIQTRHTYMIP